MASGLTFKSLIHLNLCLCHVLECPNLILLLSSFPSTTYEETVLSPLYILVSLS